MTVRGRAPRNPLARLKTPLLAGRRLPLGGKENRLFVANGVTLSCRTPQRPCFQTEPPVQRRCSSHLLGHSARVLRVPLFFPSVASPGSSCSTWARSVPVVKTSALFTTLAWMKTISPVWTSPKPTTLSTTTCRRPASRLCSGSESFRQSGFMFFVTSRKTLATSPSFTGASGLRGFRSVSASPFGSTAPGFIKSTRVLNVLWQRAKTFCLHLCYGLVRARRRLHQPCYHPALSARVSFDTDTPAAVPRPETFSPHSVALRVIIFVPITCGETIR